ARFLEAMDDDFNTGGAIGELFELVRALNRFIDRQRLEDPSRRQPEQLALLKRSAATLRELAGTLGLFRQPPEEPQAPTDQLVNQLVDLLVQLRTEARQAKNYATADRIRDGLARLGIALEDRPGGTEWSFK
ncbi:MAG TPA: cysteine--tRNA ligase, partial [Planctomycetaceae bacterium]|nr:cysteine--tRNA ligase [Planctomycetaceae bacterium]